jgi:hypothetical protein
VAELPGIGLLRKEDDNDGIAEGANEGLAVGCSDGIAVGVNEGLAVGCSDGIADGANEGVAVGIAEGKGLGENDGPADGEALDNGSIHSKLEIAPVDDVVVVPAGH